MKTVVYISIIVVLSACSGVKSLAPAEYIKWTVAEKQNYTVSDTLEQVIYNFTYVSNEEDAANCLLSSCLNEDEIKTELKKNRNNQQFKLRIKITKPGFDVFDYSASTNKYPSSERQQYFAFEMQKDIHLITKMGDTLPCTYWLYEPSMAGSGIANIECAFKSVSREEMKSILIVDKVFTGLKTEILLSKINFKNYPSLKIKSVKK